MKKLSQGTEYSRKSKKSSQIPSHAKEAALSASKLQGVIRNLLAPHLKEEEKVKKSLQEERRKQPSFAMNMNIGKRHFGFSISRRSIELHLPSGKQLSFPLWKK